MPRVSGVVMRRFESSSSHERLCKLPTECGMTLILLREAWISVSLCSFPIYRESGART